MFHFTFIENSMGIYDQQFSLRFKWIFHQYKTLLNATNTKMGESVGVYVNQFPII